MISFLWQTGQAVGTKGSGSFWRQTNDCFYLNPPGSSSTLILTSVLIKERGKLKKKKIKTSLFYINNPIKSKSARVPIGRCLLTHVTILIPHFPESHLVPRHEVVVTQRTVGGSFPWRGSWKGNGTPSHIQLNQISCKHRGRSSLRYNRLPPRKSDIKNTIESWPPIQKDGADGVYVSRCRNRNRTKKKDLIGPADDSFQTVNMGPGTFRLGNVRTFEAHGSTFFSHSTQGNPKVIVQISFIEKQCH